MTCVELHGLGGIIPGETLNKCKGECARCPSTSASERRPHLTQYLAGLCNTKGKPLQGALNVKKPKTERGGNPWKGAKAGTCRPCANALRGLVGFKDAQREARKLAIAANSDSPNLESFTYEQTKAVLQKAYGKTELNRKALTPAGSGERSTGSRGKAAGCSGRALQLMCETCGTAGATFDMAHDGKRRWCTSCRPSRAQSVISGRAQMCEICGIVGATFGMAHDGKRRWCTSCRPSGAQSLMKKNMCENCPDIRASYGIPTEDGTPAVKRWCAKCSRANPGSECLIRKRVCEDCGTSRAVVGVAGGQKRWCGRCSHKHAEADPPPSTHQKMCEDCGSKLAIYPTAAERGSVYRLPGEEPKRWCTT